MIEPRYSVIAPTRQYPAASQAESFGSAVWLLSHSRVHRQQPLWALGRTVLPAIELGQYALVLERGTEASTQRPVGYLSWAMLNPEAEARYVQNPINGLAAADWNSGERLWYVDYVVPFGKVPRIHRIFKSLQSEVSGRYMYHRSHERGVQVRRFSGAGVDRQTARQWWAQRPILAAG